jgi:hypothetical protein
MTTSLNVITFDVPYPANYGGVIDVYYKLVWFKKHGVKVHLHCFTYGRSAAPELEALCEKVYYYKRKTGVMANLSLLPYTVKSRISEQLTNNLLSNTFPILFEVLHTCYLLNDERFRNRKRIYRHSNIEHDYYLELSKSEKNLLKKVYLKIEALKLRRFESVVKHADIILAVNQKDRQYFSEKYVEVKTEYIPSFHANEGLTIQSGHGNYVLFHGNLSISENYEAALWLTEHVFSKINHQVVIAGLKPPLFLKHEIKRFANIQLIENTDEEEMNLLIHNAQVHVLYTAQPTGLKLKLLNVLFKGRFIVCNRNMIAGTNLSETSTLKITDVPKQMIDEVDKAMTSVFTKEMGRERVSSIEDFDNATNIDKLIRLVF